MKSIQKPIMLTFNPIKNYEWGKKTQSCIIRQLISQQKQFQEKPMAQLWMGVHSSGQSRCSNDQKLSQYLRNNDLPNLQFLFKVLSIEKCLSIQVHPNEQEAKKLNQLYPKIYKDPNSKPQMFLTISDQFQCFLGFVSAQKIQQIMKQPLFKDIMPASTNINEIIVHILRLDQQKQLQLCQSYRKIVQKIYPQRINLYEQLEKSYLNDVGLIISLFLEYHVLKKGQSFYIQANTPHAYIKGECLQIMKNSDNVIRLGLTPKLKDIDNISSSLPKQKIQIIEVEAINDSSKESKIFTKNGLNIQIIELAQGRILEKEKYCRIAIILSGYFSINQNMHQSQSNAQKPKGTVFLLEPGISYKIRGKGQLCIGWSSF